MTQDSNAPRARSRRFRAYLIGSIMVIGFLLLVFYRYIFVTILPGHVGVLYDWLRGGTFVEHVYGEGLVLKLPWNRIYIVETRTRKHDAQVLALSAEGMEIHVDVSALFRANPDEAGRLIKELGPDYEERIVQPLISGSVREVISRYDSTELYTQHFDRLERDLYAKVLSSPYSGLIDFQKLLVRKITLPKAVLEAIEEKLAIEQRTASYVFRLEQQRQEVERLRIEAIGIQNFYSIVSSALTENLLTWRGIEATVQLAHSPNSKVVIVGSGKDQLPLILGSDIHNLPAAKSVQGVNPGDFPSADWEQLPRLFDNRVTTQGHRNGATGVDTQDGIPLQRGEGGDGSTRSAPAQAPSGSTDSSRTKPAPQAAVTPAGAKTDAADMDQNHSDAGLAPIAAGDGLRGERPAMGFRILPRGMETPESTRAPHGAKPE